VAALKEKHDFTPGLATVLVVPPLLYLFALVDTEPATDPTGWEHRSAGPGSH
jgi:hypothetical protein